MCAYLPLCVGGEDINGSIRDVRQLLQIFFPQIISQQAAFPTRVCVCSVHLVTTGSQMNSLVLKPAHDRVMSRGMIQFSVITIYNISLYDKNRHEAFPFISLILPTTAGV